MAPARRPIAERFWEKVERRGPDDCWPWTAGKTAAGYGMFKRPGRDGTRSTAHRVAWELEHGRPVPDGLVVDHLCENRPCCNPAHLEAVTPLVNAERYYGTRPAVCPKGHALDGVARNGEGDNVVRAYCRTCKNERSRRGHRRRKAAERARIAAEGLPSPDREKYGAMRIVEKRRGGGRLFECGCGARVWSKFGEAASHAAACPESGRGG